MGGAGGGARMGFSMSLKIEETCMRKLKHCKRWLHMVVTRGGYTWWLSVAVTHLHPLHVLVLHVGASLSGLHVEARQAREELGPELE